MYPIFKRLTAALTLVATPALAQAPAETPGVSPTEIRLGQSMPYSGNGSAYASVGKAMVAYFDKLNKEQGGIGGRQIKLISLDDAFSPPKTVEATRKLVEQDDVLAIFGTLGTAPNTAVHRYLNTKKVPHLLVTTGATKWADPKNFPYTTPGLASYQTEGSIYARYLAAEEPERQDRHSHAERRLRPRLPRRLQAGSRRQRRQNDRRHADL